MTIDKLTTYLGWIVAISTLIFSWYKLRLETPGARADLAAKYHAMALQSADNEAAMKMRIDEMEARLDSVERRHAEEIAKLRAEHTKEMTQVKAALEEERQYASAMDVWAAEILAVLRSLKITTITPKPERKQSGAGNTV